MATRASIDHHRMAPPRFGSRLCLLKTSYLLAVHTGNLVRVETIELADDDWQRLATMRSVLISVLTTVRGVVRTRAALHLEILALRHQLQVLQRSHRPRSRLANADRWLWAWLSTEWTEWRTALAIVKPATVVAWHRQGFLLFWTGRSRRRTGRPPVSAGIRSLIRTMSRENPLWGAPRVHGELLKLGLQVSQTTVAKYLPRPTTTTPSSQS